jgi:hypothetical protein
MMRGPIRRLGSLRALGRARDRHASGERDAERCSSWLEHAARGSQQVVEHATRLESRTIVV